MGDNFLWPPDYGFKTIFVTTQLLTIGFQQLAFYQIRQLYIKDFVNMIGLHLKKSKLFFQKFPTTAT